MVFGRPIVQGRDGIQFLAGNSPGSTRVIGPQSVGRHLPREPVEVPVRDAAIHVLGETDDVAAVLEIAREEVLQVDPADRRQRAVAATGPG